MRILLFVPTFEKLRNLLKITGTFHLCRLFHATELLIYRDIIRSCFGRLTELYILEIGAQPTAEELRRLILFGFFQGWWGSRETGFFLCDEE
jgi:hypothetical protein